MAIKKISCGGWLYDDEQITFEDGVMKVIGGGGITEAPIDGKQYARKDAEWSEVQSSGGGAMVVTIDFDGETGTADKTSDEIVGAVSIGNYVMFKVMFNGETGMYIPFGGYEIGGGIYVQFGGILFQCESGTTWTMQVNNKT